MYNQLLIKRRDLTGEISQQKKKKNEGVFNKSWDTNTNMI